MKRTRAKPNRRRLTEDSVRRLPVKGKQYLVWDSGTDAARGLAVLVSPAGAKSFRSTFYFTGSPKPFSRHLGRVGEVTLEEARDLCRSDRRLSRQGVDPRADDPSRSDTFKATVEDYVTQEQIGRRGNTSADDTKRVLLNNTTPWHPRPIATIRRAEIDKLLASIRDGDDEHRARPYLANRLFAHLMDLFSWSTARQTITVNAMAGMKKPWEGAKPRDRVWSDDELKAIWSAADCLDIVDGCYVKLNLLTALRRNELALARWSEFDDPDNPTLLTIPTERVKLRASAKLKTKPVYRVPLPPLAIRILHALDRDTDYVFPNLKVDSLRKKLADHGAPTDFKSHTSRHCIATFLQDRGRAEFEIGLALNHAKGSSVTSGYSHGFALDLKRDLLSTWADHVEGVVAGKGVARLR